MTTIQRSGQIPGQTPAPGMDSAERSGKSKAGSGVAAASGQPLPGGGQAQADAMVVQSQAPALPGDLSGAIDRLSQVMEKIRNSEDPSALLGELLGALGESDDLGAMMIKFAQMGRDQALDQRLASREQAKSDLQAQASKTREAAVTELVSAVVTAAVSVASFAVSLGGAAKAGASGKEAMGHLKAASKADVSTEAGRATQTTQIEMARQANTTGQAAVSQAQNASTAMNAGAQVVGTSLGTASKMTQADGQEMAAESTVEQSKSDMSKKIMDDFEEMIKSTINFLKEMQRAETDLMANMTRV